MSTSTVTRDSVLETIKSNPNLTATALSKKFGFQKKSTAVDKVLVELIAAGEVAESKNAAGHNVFNYVKKEVKAPKTAAPAAAKAPPVQPMTVAEAPDLTIKDVQHYKLKIKKNGSVEVVNTKNNTKVDLTDGQSLIVINEGLQNHAAFRVNTAAEVLSVIHSYTSQQGWAAISVTDAYSAKTIGDEKDINLQERILVLNIQKVNKAA